MKYKVLTANETRIVLEEFYESCIRFWKREKECNSENYDFEINVEKQALKDVKGISTNPFSPNGGKLDTSIKTLFLMEKSKEIERLNEMDSKHKVSDSLFQIENVNVVYVREGRIPANQRYENLFYYDMRHGDDGNFAEPCTLEKTVLVDFFGTLATDKPIPSLETEELIELDQTLIDSIIENRD